MGTTVFQFLVENWYFFILALGLFIAAAGLVIIDEHEVGVVVKKFARASLPDGRYIALDGEAGYQADTLAPGWYFGYWFWQYRIEKRSIVVIPQGEIGLIVAADGKPIPSERILAKIVDCDNFQSARKFLQGGGEKGRQLGLLTAGTYRINTALFRVITREEAEDFDMEADDLKVYDVHPERVGVVTTLDGQPIQPGEIAGPSVPGHENFQNAQAFMDNGGCRGLQEQVLLRALGT